MKKATQRRASDASGAKPSRTCVGCGRRDEAAAMALLGLVGGRVVCRSLFRRVVQRSPVRGRGAHLHPRPACLARAPRGLARALRTDVRMQAGDLGQELLQASEAAMQELLLVARRQGALSPVADPAGPLVLVAVDAASGVMGLGPIIGAGRAMAWKTKRELGALLGQSEAAFCSIRDVPIASQLIRLRAAADAGMATARSTREGAECSRCPEAR